MFAAGVYGVQVRKRQYYLKPSLKVIIVVTQLGEIIGYTHVVEAF